MERLKRESGEGWQGEQAKAEAFCDGTVPKGFWFSFACYSFRAVWLVKTNGFEKVGEVFLFLFGKCFAPCQFEEPGTVVSQKDCGEKSSEEASTNLADMPSIVIGRTNSFKPSSSVG